MPLVLRYAARSDVGLIREGNEDSGYAGPALLMVADGMGGHAAGELASAIAVATVADLDGDSIFDSFVNVTPGTVVTFTVTAYNDSVAQTAVDQVFTVHLQVIGDGVTVLDEKPVIIVVPRLGT